jgi:adenylate cyclase
VASRAENLAKITEVLTASYDEQDTRVVPKRTDLTFGNTIKRINHAVVMYVDMRASRKILRNSTPLMAVKVHRAFLQAIVYSVEGRDGHFRSFNGDGALAFFVGPNAASRAVRAAMDLKGYVREMNKVILKQIGRPIDFGVGIAQGEVRVAKSGKGGEDQTKQDLVWIGTAVYLAVELSDLASDPANIWISLKVREAIGKQDHLKVVRYASGKSKWKKVRRNLKFGGNRDLRYTTSYFEVGGRLVLRPLKPSGKSTG